MRARSDPWRRPFLGLARSEVHEAAAELLGPTGRQAWRYPHNVDLAYARVRVRELLAGLGQALGPGVAVGLSRSAELLRDDADALDALADSAFVEHVTATGVEASADADALLGLVRAVRTRVIRLMGLHVGCPSDEFGFDRVSDVEAFVVDWHGQGALRLPGRVEATRAYGRLSLRSTIDRPSDVLQ
jgi:tRNA(Ile)-lysidine synthase